MDGRQKSHRLGGEVFNCKVRRSNSKRGLSELHVCTDPKYNFFQEEDGDTDCRFSAAGARKQTIAGLRLGRASDDPERGRPNNAAYTKFGSLKAEGQVQPQDKAGNDFQILHLHQRFAHVLYKY